MPIGQGARNNINLGSLGRSLLFDTNIKATSIDEDIFSDQEALTSVADSDRVLILDVSTTPDEVKYITVSNFTAGLPVLTGSTDNTLVTVTGSEAITGEANLTFDGTGILQIGAASNIEPRLDLLNDENSFQLGIANGSNDMITGSADGDVVLNSVGDHNMLFAQNDTLAITLDTDGDVTFANNIDGGTWLGTAVGSQYGGTGQNFSSSTGAISVSSGTMSAGTLAVSNGGTGATTLNNLITLTTHTTGNYVATITGGTGITSTAATTGEGTTHSLSVDASQTQITSVGTISTGVWQGTAIASTYIAGDAITGAKIADDALDSEHYTDGSIDTAHLAADAITGAKIADDAIDSEHYTDGSIDTAHIADDQVTLAKMAGLTRGSIIYGNASGNPTALAKGSANYVLTSDGTDIAWAASTAATKGFATAMAIAL